MPNPFTLRLVPPDPPFCNRAAEQSELFPMQKTRLMWFCFRRGATEKHRL